MKDKRTTILKIYSQLKLYILSIILLFLVIFPLFLPVRFEIPQNAIWGIGTLMIWLSVVIIFILIHTLKKSAQNIRLLKYLNVFSDILFLAIILAVFAKITGPYFFLFALIIIGAAFYLDLRLIFTSGVVTIGILIFAFIFEVEDPIKWAQVITLILECFFVAVITYFVYFLALSYKELIWQNEKLRRLSLINKELLAQTSNNLRLPLPLIRDYIQLFIDNKLGRINNQQRRIMLKIHQMSEKMIDEANAAIYFDQLKSKTLSLIIKSFDLTELVRQVVERHRADFVNKNIKISYRTIGKSLNISADKAKTAHLVSSFIKNALIYGNRGNELLLQIEKNLSGNFIFLKINFKDINLPGVDLERIFDKKKKDLAYRVDVYIANEIMRKMGGVFEIIRPGNKKPIIFVLTFKV